jgi:hypothetical protein
VSKFVSRVARKGSFKNTTSKALELEGEKRGREI